MNNTNKTCETIKPIQIKSIFYGWKDATKEQALDFAKAMLKHDGLSVSEINERLRGIQFTVEELRKELNTLARERMKTKLLSDIEMDMTTCKVEGWDHLEYLRELQDMISDILKNKQ